MKTSFAHHIWLVLSVALVLAPLPIAQPGSVWATAATPAPDASSENEVTTLMGVLTPEQKIGQLFLVTFDGASAAPDTNVGRLIREQHIGGVILSSVNENFINSPDTPRQIAELTNALQMSALESNAGIPLFVALDHEGDNYPYTRVTGGMTPLPNPMAIGATWQPENARAVGEIAGRELSALGFNLLLGPDVDVLNNPRPSGRGDIGTRTFGGDPWWVAQMGRAYICGAHQGSAGRMGTVAKHFPGHGGSDRLPDREIATVDKSLSELKRIELPPFFAVTDVHNAGDCGITDAMMTSHIRYRGLQGNIRQFTAPISFDAEGLGTILGLSEFAAWQQSGLIVSDALGVPAVARYFDPLEKTFPHRQVAKEALMAGNDLLSIDQFARPQAAILQTQNLADTVAYFQEEYRANPAFRLRVEEAVSRILRTKLRLYGGSFAAEKIAVDPQQATAISGQGGAIVSNMAQEAITLIHPLAGALPAPPRRDEDIVIFTDAERVKDCRAPACEWYEALPVSAVQDTILRLYGPNGTGQIDPGRIHSVSFADLKTHLQARLEITQPLTPTAGVTPVPPPADITGLLEEAEWIIFAMRNADRDTTSDAVRVFLDNGTARLYDRKLVVLAFNAPYYLDTTEINKLTLYLAAYSKIPAFIEAAVRVLFGELSPAGHSPVNIEGINYDLLRQLAPDPSRPFALDQVAPAAGDTLRAPTALQVRAGPLVDHNGNLVPDGTEVVFQAAYEAGGQFVPAVRATSSSGFATATLSLDLPGPVVLSARSGDAGPARPLRLVLVGQPTPSPTVTESPIPPAATPTTSASPALQPSATSSPTPLPEASTLPSSGGAAAAATRAGMLLVAVAGSALACVLGHVLARVRQAAPERRLRWALLCLSGGMAGYSVYLLLLPGADQLSLASLGAAFAGSALALPVWMLGERRG